MFVYGSLVSPARAALDRTVRPGGFVADVRGARRSWGVAMDNRHDLPAYKYYLDACGRRPEVFVAFLDLQLGGADDGAKVNGVCLPADGATLARLDARERNYDRTEITDRLDAAVGPAQVWTYVGSAAGRARLREGRRTGRAVIHAAYLEAVRAGFGALGEPERAACEPSLAPGPIPVVALTRHEIPDGSGRE